MIAFIWRLIVGNPIAQMLAKIGGLILGVLTMRALWKREGAQAQRSEAKEEDYEHAQDIRDRVIDDRAQRVRELDGRGYRD